MMAGSAPRRMGNVEVQPVSAAFVLRTVEGFRVEAARKLDISRRVELGQFLTPLPVAKFMASMCQATGASIRILDAGAGVGSLSAALVAGLCTRDRRPTRLSVCAYELDSALIEYLVRTMHLCEQLCTQEGIHFDSEIRSVDFIQSAT